MSALLSLNGVELRFPVYADQTRSLRNALVQWTASGRFAKGGTDRLFFSGLKNISLELRQGDSLGLVGPNGAGKSTLLKLLAGVYEPTFGSIIRRGSITTLFDVSLGMESDATGYENIFLILYLRGLRRREILPMVDEIIAFSDLAEHIHMPVRTYSAGMVARLVFSISTAVKPDILLIDEVFAVGDQEFLLKAHERLSNLIRSASLLVFASHNHALITTFCRDALMLRGGEMIRMGPAKDVVRFYEDDTLSRLSPAQQDEPPSTEPEPVVTSEAQA